MKNKAKIYAAFRRLGRELWRGAVAIWFYASPELAEIFSAAWLVTWGIILLCPGHAFDASSGYDALRVLPEASWGTAALLIGLAQFLAVLYGCVCKRRVAARVSAGLYLLLTVMFIFGKWPITIAFYGGHATTALWVFWRLSGRECKKSDQLTAKLTTKKTR